MTNCDWSWVVGGGGALQATITVPDSDVQVEKLRAATQPLEAAIYVRKQDGTYPWGGPVITRTAAPDGSSITITCIEWRTWLNFLILNPAASADVLYSYTQVDQIAIARALVAAATAGGDVEGNAPMLIGTEPLSGRLRDLNFWGSEMKRLGPQIDTMANRDGGFEWSVEVRQHATDGLPQLYFTTYYPQQGGLIPGLMFKATASGANCQIGDIEENASSKFTRYWTTGSGQPPDQVYAYDVDPNLASGRILRLDGSTSFSNIQERTTLASHARAIRRFYEPGTNFLKVTHLHDKIDPDSYSVGDRGRVLVQNRFHSFDLPAARIIEKKVSVKGQTEITLDITDITLPETDTGGSV